MLARLPIRWRLTLIFAAAATALMLVLGAAVHLLLVHSLEGGVRDGLRADARSVQITLAAGNRSLSPGSPAMIEAGVGFAEVIGRGGEVLAVAPRGGPSAALSREAIVRARRGRMFVRGAQVPGVDDPVLLLAEPVARGAGDLEGAVVVVGGSLRDPRAAVEQVDRLMLAGGLLSLLVLSFLAYALAGRSLAPVTRMRTEAGRLSASGHVGELSLPPARDEIRALGQTLNALLAEIAAATDRERLFLAGASHELRTPLVILTQELELASAAERSDEEVRAGVTSALEETRLLARIADDLLLLARSDAGEPLADQLSLIDADDLLAGVAERFADRARTAGRVIDVAPSGAVLRGDDLRLQQALSNLVDNALRHGRGDVALGAREGADEACELFVRDCGTMPADVVDRAFERFARGDRRSGAGLGLAIVRSIARAHGGEARLVTTARDGLEVVLSLPAAPGAAPHVEALRR